MSTLGRKSMKKTLKLLREDAFSATKSLERESRVFISKSKKWVKSGEKIMKEGGKPEELTKELLAYGRMCQDYISSLLVAFTPILKYLESLDSYAFELDEAWDNLLKRMEQATKEIVPPKKEKKKKTPYIN